tara:strand:+ start:1133 stop:2116 length:984 start_codon:yes stop_codon:yes gene_type:complete
MKVLHITNAYPSVGNPIKGVFIKEQIESLELPVVKNDVFFIDVSSKGINAYIKAIIHIFKVKKNYDVIHAHHVFSAIVAIFAGASKRLITSFLSDGENEVMVGPKFFRIIVFKLAYIFSKKRIFKLKARVGSSPNNYFIQNGVNTTLFHILDMNTCKSALGLDLNKRYILFVSGQNLHRPEKRYDLFLRVLEKLKSMTPAHESEILPLAISDATRETITQYYNAADCYLLTSDFEGSPNAVKEALACGTPVVSRNVGSAIELLDGIPNSEVVNSVDINLLAEAVFRSIKDVSSSEIRSAFMKKKLDKNAISHQIVSIYNEIIKEAKV